MEKIDENPSQQRTFHSNESLENSYDDRSSKLHGRTQSYIQTRLTPIGSPQSSKVTFDSIERLKAFKSKAFNKHAVQPYIKSDCKFVMKNAGETLSTNMRRQYGFMPLHEIQRGAQTQRIAARDQQYVQGKPDEKCLQLQKVPLQARDGLMFSDVASPNESVYAKRKLLSKQRKELAMAVQSEHQNRRLELGYNIASPAARMRSLLMTE